MIEVFYYIGLFCLISCIEEVFNIKKLKKSNRFINETLDDIKVNDLYKKIGTDVEFKEELSSFSDKYKKTINKINPIRVIIGLITTFWNVVGIFITEQKVFFIVLFVITFFSTYLIRAITKDERQQLILSYITNIVSLLFVLAISYNHFFKGVV